MLGRKWWERGELFILYLNLSLSRFGWEIDNEKENEER